MPTKCTTARRRDTSIKWSTAAEKAYATYLGMGIKRSLRKLHTELLREWGKNAPSFRTIESWSVKYEWQRRLEDFDLSVLEEQEKRLRAYLVSEAPKRIRKQLDNATLLRVVGEKGLTNNDEPIDPCLVESKDLAVYSKLLMDSGHIERLHLGLATSRIESQGPGGSSGPAPAATINVLGPEALAELRQVIDALPEPVPMIDIDPCR